MRPQFAPVAFGLAGLVALAVLFPAGAADAQPSDKTEFGAAVYGFFPHIGGQAVTPTGGGLSIDIDANRILDNTDFAFMGAFNVQKGRFGAFTDVMHMNIGASQAGLTALANSSVPLPPGLTVDASLDVKAWVWTVAASYRALNTPGAVIDLFGGARMLDVNAGLGWAFNVDLSPMGGPPQRGEVEMSGRNWDAIGGVKGRINLGTGKWFIPYYADAGAGQSDFTWQGAAGLGYAFGHSDIVATWRYLKYELEPGGVLTTLDFNGPGVGVTFRW